MGREEGPGAEAEKEGHWQLKPGGAAQGVCVPSASFLSHLLLNFPFEGSEASEKERLLKVLQQARGRVGLESRL